jgi:hypothetical protein
MFAILTNSSFPSFATVCARRSSEEVTKKKGLRCQLGHCHRDRVATVRKSKYARSFFDNVKVGIIQTRSIRQVTGVHVIAYTPKKIVAQLRFHFVTLRTESGVFVSGEIQESRLSDKRDYCVVGKLALIQPCQHLIPR